eukprot:jgi/Ulvmu1/9244/UM005_0344.1
MPNIRFKVNGAGKPTQKAELSLEDSFDAGLAAILTAACLEASSDTWLSLNKQEALHPPSNGRFFSVIRPGDLVWVMAPTYRSQQSAHSIAIDEHRLSPLDSSGSLSDAFRAEALLRLAGSIATTPSIPSAGTIAAAIVDSAAKDTGFMDSAQSLPDASATGSQCADIGCWRRDYSNAGLSATNTFTAWVFEIAGSQVIYMHIPNSNYGIKQHVVPNRRLQLPDSTSRSKSSVLASLDPVYQTIKSKLMVWAANAMLLCEGRQQQYGLLALPTEALANVFSRLGYADVATVATVSRRLKIVTADHSIWEALLKKEFSQEASPGKDARELFKEAISDRKRRREALQSMHRPGGYRRDPIFPPAPRLPPALPGVVGGDYDRLPPGVAHVPFHPLGGNACMDHTLQAPDYRAPGGHVGVLGRAARREAGIGGGRGDSMFGGGRSFGGGPGFGGFGGGPFRGRPF